MRTIAIMVENSRAYGRAMIEGIASFAQDGRDWILRPFSVEEAFTTKLKDFDGVIARIADERLATRLVRSGLPTVDVFCQSAYPGIAGVDSDHDSIGRLARDFFGIVARLGTAKLGQRASCPLRAGKVSSPTPTGGTPPL